MKPVGELWIVLFPASIMVYGLELVFKGRDLSDWNCQTFHFSWFSCLFTVPRDENKWRPIIDLSKLYKKIKKKYFSMEDLKKSTKIIHPGLCGVQIGPQRCVPSHSLSQRNLKNFPVCNSDRLQNRGFLQSSALRP